MGELALLSQKDIETIHSASFHLLEKTGLAVRNKAALHLLEDAGCTAESNRVRFPSDLVETCLSNVPRSFKLYSREQDRYLTIGGNDVIFNPGSSASDFLDANTGEIRRATSRDLVNLIELSDALPCMDAVSTAMIASDVPESISDSFRLYVVLNHSDKPIVTGAFTKEGLGDMRQMLEAAVGGSEELAESPRAIFDCCPTSPLTWNDVSSQNLIDCATSSIPAEIVPAPMMGATGPVSIFGTLVQSNAEILAGIVIAETTNPGTPVVYGGSLALFDMKQGMICLGAIETAMAACAASQIGKHYGMPTHAYLGLSESKLLDAQSGFESAIGLVLASLARINVVSGPGMLAFENCQSLEKLVIDNEICGMARRLMRGIDPEDPQSILTLLDAVGPGGEFLSAEHTLSKFRREQYLTSEIVCRRPVHAWRELGCSDANARARKKAESTLNSHSSKPMPDTSKQSLDSTLKMILKKHGVPIRSIPAV